MSSMRVGRAYARILFPPHPKILYVTLILNIKTIIKTHE